MLEMPGWLSRLEAGLRRIAVEDQRAGAAAVAGEREHLPHLAVLATLEVADHAGRRDRG